MLIEELLAKWRPVWAPEDETGGGDGDTGGGDDTDDGTGGDDTDTSDADTKTGDEDEGPGTILDGGTADESEDNSGEDDGEGDDADGDDDSESEVPEEYDFSEVELPEGMELDSEFVAAATPVLKELGLDQEQANKLAKMQADYMAATAQASIESAQQIVKGWVDTAKADKEIGGGEWDETVRLGNSVIRQFGTPELVQDVMVGQGIGNHPEVIRLLARIGKHVASDTSPTGNETDGDAVPQEQAWYGETTPATKQR